MVFFFRPLYTVFAPHNHHHQITQGTREKKTQKKHKSLALEPVPPRSPRIQGGREGKAELKSSGAGGKRSEESYRVLAAADGLVDMEVVHSREAGGGGGALLSSPVRLGFEIREDEACGSNGGGRRGGIWG